MEVVFDADFAGINLASWDLILAALFLWITFFLAARSASETALIIVPSDFLLFAVLIAASSLLTISLFTDSFFVLPLRARFDDLVTGIYISKRAAPFHDCEYMIKKLEYQLELAQNERFTFQRP